ncbi:aminoimidazole riboside kinase [compost metagenome]
MSEPGVKVNVIDTTGAGDAFIGALLYQISQMNDFNGRINPAVASEMLAFANKAAAITTTRSGAIPGLPTRSEVEST